MISPRSFKWCVGRECFQIRSQKCLAMNAEGIRRDRALICRCLHRPRPIQPPTTVDLPCNMFEHTGGSTHAEDSPLVLPVLLIQKTDRGPHAHGTNLLDHVPVLPRVLPSGTLAPRERFQIRHLCGRGHVAVPLVQLGIGGEVPKRKNKRKKNSFGCASSSRAKARFELVGQFR